MDARVAELVCASIWLVEEGLFATCLVCQLLSISVPLLLLLVFVFTQDHLADPYHVTFATNGVSVPFLHN